MGAEEGGRHDGDHRRAVDAVMTPPLPWTGPVVESLAWSFVIEGLLVGLLPEVGRWLPGGAAAA